jgi:hypothetical protein
MLPGARQGRCQRRSSVKREAMSIDDLDGTLRGLLVSVFGAKYEIGGE